MGMPTIRSDTSGVAGRRLAIVQIRQPNSVLPGATQQNPASFTVIHPPLSSLRQPCQIPSRRCDNEDRAALDDQL